jgi:TRAP transporter TAXI family solute receptor
MYRRCTFLRLAALAVSLLWVPSVAGQTCDATLLTGSKNGYYYKLGMAIRQVADRTKDLNLCVQTTDNNLENIKQLEAGKVDFAIAQSDAAHDAWYGHPPKFQHRAADVHIVMPLYLEAVHILLRPHLNISRLEDLRGKKVGVYLSGGGTEYTAGHILAAVGLQSEGTGRNFDAVSTTDAVFCNSVQKLMDGGLDALFRVSVVPSFDLQDALNPDPSAGEKADAGCTAAREVRLLALDHELAERLVRDGSYIETLIPKSAYGQSESTLTVGVQALLLAGKNASGDHVEKLARILRLKHAAIEEALNESINPNHVVRRRPGNLPTLSLLDVPMPALMRFVHPRAKKYVYHWWRNAWQSELIILGALIVLAALMFWKRNWLGRAMEQQPNLTFAIAGTLLIWFIGACVLYHYGGVDEHFNSFPRSLISTFLYLASCPGYGLPNQDADSFAQMMKWISLVLLGGFASPLLKQGLDTLLEKLSKWLQNKAPASEGRAISNPVRDIRPIAPARRTLRTTPLLLGRIEVFFQHENQKGCPLTSAAQGASPKHGGTLVLAG